MDKRYCTGCKDNFYNAKGNSPTGECRLLSGAKLIARRRVAIDERPPWRRESEILPECYRQHGYIFVDPEQER